MSSKNKITFLMDDESLLFFLRDVIHEMAPEKSKTIRLSDAMTFIYEWTSKNFPKEQE